MPIVFSISYSDMVESANPANRLELEKLEKFRLLDPDLTIDDHSSQSSEH